MTAVERLTMDLAMEDLAIAQERIRSLEADVEVYREMVQTLLRHLHSETEQVCRLMFRLERANGTADR